MRAARGLLTAVLLALGALVALSACAELLPAPTPTRTLRYAAVATDAPVPTATVPARPGPARTTPAPEATSATPGTPAAATPRPRDVVGPWLRLVPMGTPRTGHSATLLPGGQLLVAGGEATDAGQVTPLSTTEWYDPLVNQWSAVGDLAEARVGHTATLLRDGSVLVVGGLGASVELATAERFVPSSGVWSPAGALATARAAHTATLLADGRVLVVGGESTNSATGRVNEVRTAELYDPATNRWQSAGRLNAARVNHSATLLPDGRVLVAGGESVTAGRLSSVELFDPETGGWRVGSPMGTARSAHSATLLAAGRLLVAGGDDPSAGGAAPTASSA